MGADLRFEALVEAHVRDLRQRRLSSTLQSHAQLVLPRFFAFLRAKSVRDVRAVSEAHLVSYVRSLERYTTRFGRPLTASSRASFVAVLKRFFRYLSKRRLILQDPTRDLRNPKIYGLPRRVLSEAQAARLMTAPSPDTVVGLRDRAILEVFYGTGIRSGECSRLELTDYDPGRRTLCIRSGKGKKDRFVPVPARAAAALDLYLSQARPELLRHGRETGLFLSRYGASVSDCLLLLMIRKYAEAAGIEGPVSPHVFRHSCATHLLKGGADIRHVQKLLGHSKLESTAIYTRVNITDLKDALRRSHPREKGNRRRTRA